MEIRTEEENLSDPRKPKREASHLNTKSTSQKNEWKQTLILIRGFNTLMATKLALAQKKPVEGLLVGIMAYQWGAWMQKNNTHFLNWLMTQGWFSSDPHDPATPLRRTLKKAASAGLYALIIQGAIDAGPIVSHTMGYVASGGYGDLPSFKDGISFLTHFASLDTLTKVTSQALISSFTQTKWQALNQQLTQKAKEKNPEKKDRYEFFSALGSVVQSGYMNIVNVLSAQHGVERSLGVSMGILAGVTGHIAQRNIDKIGYFASKAKENIRIIQGKLKENSFQKCTNIFSILGARVR